MNRTALALTLAALATVPALARAQDASTAGALDLYPTYECIGVRLPYAGDANGNATAHIEYQRPGALVWTQGVDMVRITNSRWAGSILWLQPNRAYNVRVVIDDPDGGVVTPAVSVRTRAPYPSTPTGATWWVDVNGNDANSGTAGSPLATWQAAAKRVQPGDEIRVRPGVYYQSLVTPRGGTLAAPIVLDADGPGVVLDGSDPNYLHRTDWLDETGGIFSIDYAPSGNRLVCADSTQRLYKQASLADLQSGANGMTQGFAVENGRLYVKLEDGSNPSGHTMHVARTDVGIYHGHSYWHISGLTVRYFGMTPHSNASGICLENSDSNWVANCRIETIGGRGIMLKTSAKANLIEQNLVVDPRVGYWPWKATKGHDEEITGISNRGGRGNVIRFNTVRGGFDGLDANTGDGDEDIAADADYYGNVVTDNADDAIETDTVSGINIRVWRNTFDNTFDGVSMAPVYQGPEYVLYNVISRFKHMCFKFSYDGVGQLWICQNTTWTNNSGTAAWWPSGPYSNAHSRNNILMGNQMPAVNDDPDESKTGCDFNGDLLFALSSSVLFHWKGQYYNTLPLMQTATGFEAGGKAGDPGFVSALTGDFRLSSLSPAIDTAVPLHGINDRYVGAGPDIGAIEFSTTGDAIPPAPINDLR